MSFGTYARKVRDPALPFTRRVSALRSAVELYGPLGFHNSLSFLEEIAGRYRTDEAALLRALDALAASRTQWHVALDAYAQERRLAKQSGQRSPRPGDFNPNHPDRWHGDAQRAALHVMRGEQAEVGRLAHAVGPGSVEAELSELLNASVAAQGQLSAAQRNRLATLAASLRARIRPENEVTHSHIRRLRRLAELTETALGSDPPSSVR